MQAMCVRQPKAPRQAANSGQLRHLLPAPTTHCTATQPAVHYDEAEFPIGLKNCREIITDTKSLFDALKRVEIESLGNLPDAALVQRLVAHPQVLCIVNRRKHAQQLYQMLGQGRKLSPLRPHVPGAPKWNPQRSQATSPRRTAHPRGLHAAH
jgi:hypothetical protein